MGRKIVLDIVFRGRSLNYDQGAGNLQELKKLVLPNGSVHTLVSKYALRYSLLETMSSFKENEKDVKHLTFAPGTIFKSQKEQGANKSTYQPNPLSLLTGEIFNYDEYVLFGFLIAVEGIQVQRENPTKITHAVSLTPFEGNILFYGNHSIAKRYTEVNKRPSLDINIFNKEEHEALYGYTIVIDLEKIKK